MDFGMTMVVPITTTTVMDFWIPKMRAQWSQKPSTGIWMMTDVPMCYRPEIETVTGSMIF